MGLHRVRGGKDRSLHFWNRWTLIKASVLLLAATGLTPPGSNPRAASPAPVETVALMAPLFMASQSEMQSFDALPQQAASIGVDTVTVDVSVFQTTVQECGGGPGVTSPRVRDHF